MSFFFGFPEFFTKCVVMEPHTDRYARSVTFLKESYVTLRKGWEESACLPQSLRLDRRSMYPARNDDRRPFRQIINHRLFEPVNGNFKQVTGQPSSFCMPESIHRSIGELIVITIDS